MSTLILALNPCVDAEWRVDDVRWEEKNNVHSERRWAGGKGLNVARWLKHLGGQPQFFLPLGGQTGDELSSYLREEKIPAQIIPLREPTRVNGRGTNGAGFSKSVERSFRGFQRPERRSPDRPDPRGKAERADLEIGAPAQA